VRIAWDLHFFYFSWRFLSSLITVSPCKTLYYRIYYEELKTYLKLLRKTYKRRQKRKEFDSVFYILGGKAGGRSPRGASTTGTGTAA
jgi:hypothetical protein